MKPRIFRYPEHPVAFGIFSLIAVLIFLVAFPASSQAGFLDQLKANAKRMMDEKLDEMNRQAGTALPNPVNPTANAPAPAANTPAPSSGDWQKTATFSDDAARLMKLVDAPRESPSVLDIPLRGIRLGMPLRIADRILRREGFGKIPYQDGYSMEVRKINGQIKRYTQDDLSKLGNSGEAQGEVLERYLIRLQAKEVSEDMINELDDGRKAMVEEARQMMEQEKATQAQQTADGYRTRRQRSASGSTSPFGGRPVQLIYYIEYRQLYYGNQQFDHKLALEQARKAFGVPSYNGGPQGRRGMAYQTSSEHQLIYLDALLRPASEREAFVLEAAPEQQEVMKMGISHPCSAINRGRCANGAYPAAAFPGNLELQLKLARLQGAPYMMVTHDTAKGMKVIQEWVYLMSGDTVREHFREKKAMAAEPMAQVTF